MSTPMTPLFHREIYFSGWVAKGCLALPSCIFRITMVAIKTIAGLNTLFTIAAVSILAYRTLSPFLVVPALYYAIPSIVKLAKAFFAVLERPEQELLLQRQEQSWIKCLGGIEKAQKLDIFDDSLMHTLELQHFTHGPILISNTRSSLMVAFLVKGKDQSDPVVARLYHYMDGQWKAGYHKSPIPFPEGPKPLNQYLPIVRQLLEERHPTHELAHPDGACSRAS